MKLIYREGFREAKATPYAREFQRTGSQAFGVILVAAVATETEVVPPLVET